MSFAEKPKGTYYLVHPRTQSIGFPHTCVLVNKDPFCFHILLCNWLLPTCKLPCSRVISFCELRVKLYALGKIMCNVLFNAFIS